jgi:hypothetical protein
MSWKPQYKSPTKPATLVDRKMSRTQELHFVEGLPCVKLSVLQSAIPLNPHGPIFHMSKLRLGGGDWLPALWQFAGGRPDLAFWKVLCTVVIPRPRKD